MGTRIRTDFGGATMEAILDPAEGLLLTDDHAPGDNRITPLSTNAMEHAFPVSDVNAPQKKHSARRVHFSA